MADELDRLSVGKPAPDITGTAYDGRPMKLSDYRGKVVLLEFSTVGSDKYDKLVARTAGKPFAVVVVDVGGDPAKTKAFLEKNKPAWRAWPDGQTWAGPIQKDWHVRSYPMPYLIDPAGVIRYKGTSLRKSSARRPGRRARPVHDPRRRGRRPARGGGREVVAGARVRSP